MAEMLVDVALSPLGSGHCALTYCEGEHSWFVSDELGQLRRLGGEEVPKELSGVSDAISAFAMNAAGDSFAIAHNEGMVSLYEHPGCQPKEVQFSRRQLSTTHLEFFGNHL